MYVKGQVLYLRFLKHYYWICLKVGHIDRLAFIDDGWVFFRHQPTHVREEETPVGIMGICICIRVFMMQSVVSHPDVQAVL